jgi:hypothetical protein
VRSITQFYHGETPPLSSLLRSRFPPCDGRRGFKIQYRTAAKFLGKKHKTHFPACPKIMKVLIWSVTFKTALVKFLTISVAMFQVSAGDLHILNSMEQTKGKFNSNIKVFRRFQYIFVKQNNR